MSQDKKNPWEGLMYLLGLLAVVGLAYIVYMVVMDELIKF